MADLKNFRWLCTDTSGDGIAFLQMYCYAIPRKLGDLSILDKFCH